VKTIALVFLTCVAISIGGLLGGILGAFLGLRVYGPIASDEGSLIILFPFGLGVAIGGLLGLILSVTLWRASREE
jgi:hypothetical protein